METMMGRALGDLAKLAAEKWYALMGLFGFLILTWVLLFGTPHDDLLIGLIAAAMAALGAAEGETRGEQQALANDMGYLWKIIAPTREITPLGAALYCAFLLATGAAIWRAIVLF